MGMDGSVLRRPKWEKVQGENLEENQVLKSRCRLQLAVNRCISIANLLNNSCSKCQNTAGRKASGNSSNKIRQAATIIKSPLIEELFTASDEGILCRRSLLGAQQHLIKTYKIYGRV